MAVKTSPPGWQTSSLSPTTIPESYSLPTLPLTSLVQFSFCFYNQHFKKAFWTLLNKSKCIVDKRFFREITRESDCKQTCIYILCAPSHTTLCNLMDYSQPGSSVHGIFQERILEWVAISYSRRSS